MEHPADGSPRPDRVAGTETGRGASAGFAPGIVDAVVHDLLRHDAGVYGIVGLQGSGKSTLAAQVAEAVRACGVPVALLSIDDLYLDRPARVALACDVHPLLATRGPPGTHDVALACATLDALRRGDAVALPRFDKLADRPLPRARWPRVAASPTPQRVILEGWFLATPAQDDAALAAPVNALERDEDLDGRWRRWCNAALRRDYPPLWSRIDRLLLLQGPGFQVVPAWRWQQEQTLQARAPARTGMSRAEVDRFVALFERTSRRMLDTVPALADRVLLLDAARRPLPAAGARALLASPLPARPRA